jgi:hypothetical protein
MRDPWTTPGRPNANRFICPLGDWFFDEPSEPPFFGIAGHEARMKDTEALIRQHVEEHALEEWIRAATQLHLLLHAASPLAELKAPDPDRLQDVLTVSETRWLTLARPIIEELSKTKAVADA